jgi:hypothetical protein
MSKAGPWRCGRRQRPSVVSLEAYRPSSADVAALEDTCFEVGQSRHSVSQVLNYHGPLTAPLGPEREAKMIMDGLGAYRSGLSRRQGRGALPSKRGIRVTGSHSAHYGASATPPTKELGGREPGGKDAVRAA